MRDVVSGTTCRVIPAPGYEPELQEALRETGLQCLLEGGLEEQGHGLGKGGTLVRSLRVGVGEGATFVHDQLWRITDEQPVVVLVEDDDGQWAASFGGQLIVSARNPPRRCVEEWGIRDDTERMALAFHRDAEPDDWGVTYYSADEYVDDSGMRAALVKETFPEGCRDLVALTRLLSVITIKTCTSSLRILSGLSARH